ncbi:MAG: TRAP transporter substrate-binding protein [Victivallales bacterium]|nr:TRAP transporter substrate-binding protein [Victivallales bacterium]
MRAFMVVMFSAVLAVLLASCGKESSEVIVLSYANFPPPETFPCVQMERWKEEVEKRSGGRIRIKTYPGGTLLGAKEIYDGVVSGTAAIGNFAMSYQPGRFPVSEAVDLPHFFPDSKTASRRLAEMLKQENPAEFSEVKILTAFTCPPGVIMSAKPVESVTDLQRSPLRSSGTSLEALKLLGAAPVAMPQSDVPDALHKGVISGIVSSGEVMKDMNYAAYCKNVVEARLPVISFAVVMNRKRWDALPDDLKKILDDLYLEQADWTGAYVDQHVQDAFQWSKDTHQVQIRQITDTELADIRTRLAPIMESYVKRVAAKGIDGQKLIQFLQSDQETAK